MNNIMISIGLVFLLGFSSVLVAQDGKTREEKKQARKEKIEREYETTREIIETKQFVLETNYLENRYGQRIPVPSSLNFIMVDSTNAVIQVGSPSGMGYNGVGGITAEGQITDFELNKNDEKNNLSISMNIMTNLGIYDIFMNIGADGQASARLSGLRGGQLTYTGRIIPQGQSYVYKGTTTY
ncbi:MAG: DUF4251 domain-containing protein [Bacteroidota bacterium]